MTVKEKTICSMIQAFPVMLILAQNHDKCLDTPFEYHPPHPTHSTDYYEALEALVQTLYHQTEKPEPTYDCDTFHQYGKGYYGPKHKPCPSYHSHGDEDPYPTSGYPQYKPGYPPNYHNKYPNSNNGNSHHKYPNSNDRNYHHKYPNSNDGTLYGINTYGYNVKKGVYNRTGSGHKGYAPTQVYSGSPKIKVKVVVKKNKIGGVKRGAAAKMQVGYYPTASWWKQTL